VPIERTVNTFAASTRRIPRPALIGIVVLVAAFAALMLARSGVIGGSSSESVPVATPAHTSTTPPRTATQKPAVKPKIVLLAGLPTSVAHALRYSKVVVVSLYAGPAKSDRSDVAAARIGARSAGAGFVAMNVISNRTATALIPFVGTASAPTMIVVRRPGKIVARFEGSIDSAIVAQAAHNAGARRR
jgi:hypothetical protein